MNQLPETLQVSPTYRHYEKIIRGHGVIDPTTSRLKWYDINPIDQPIEQAVRDIARGFVLGEMTSDRGPSAREMGFVLLHRCGERFYFLGLCTWRGNNELWKTIFFFETDTMEDFALFPQDGPHKDTFCVWELAVVSHETQAWTTYLLSTRTEIQADKYLTTVL
ncbi:hypothetical protein [uncultured Litoreibacter sp.]|uniref:hypothetical protein n=1 Tax=uncultured Litoreibacter sp. TaxID=1392394 RepID=UPI0026241A16|nr:hypothetical protein [uncultured Litoreibacter sp.]